MRRFLSLGIVLALLVTGCAKKKRVKTPASTPAFTEEIGIASWYGYPYHGRRAANGEIYDMEELTAAHRTLPFGTWVRVHNFTNGKTVEVRITDRGPFIEGRIIDLSRAAARQIDLIGPGTARVRLELIATPASLTSGVFAVQVGAFRNRAGAERFRLEMEKRYGSATLTTRQGDLSMWRVLVGRAATPEEAAVLAEKIRLTESGIAGSPFVVRADGIPSTGN